jgi:hypothetical protein
MLEFPHLGIVGSVPGNGLGVEETTGLNQNTFLGLAIKK